MTGDSIVPPIPGIFVTVPDFGIQTPQLIRNRGFGYELHVAVAKDGGFHNGIHRIINPRIPVPRSTILIFHGITGSSDNFLDTSYDGFINEPPTYVGANLAFELAKRGHDVWLLDQRGTPFSSNNTFYTKNQKEYWQWSLDDIALLDLPAAVDYVIRYTKRKTIGYIGHSQVRR